MPHRPGSPLLDLLREPGRELARAWRTAAKRPAFSLVAVATLAIGIGASTATFSIADAVLMRPLPVHEQRNLSVLWGVDSATIAGVAVLVCLVTGLATCIPARRAASVEPTVALRE